MTPSELLFEKPFGKGNQSLFQSQTELVKEITEHNESSWKDKNFNSVRAFVNQVINGERKLSDKLKEAIFLVLPPRVENSEELSFIQEKIQVVFADHFNEKKERKKQPYAHKTSGNAHFIEADDFFLLEKRGLLADSILVTTRRPGIINNHELGNEIRIQLLQKTGLIESDHKLSNYIFFFPEPNGFDDFSFRFWQELYNYLRYEMGVPEADTKLFAINEGENARIKTFTAPAILCSYPIIIYDLNTRAEVGFTVFDYFDKGVEKVSTARISPGFLKWWKDAVFNPYLINKENEEYPVKEVVFRQVYEDIQKNEGIF